MPARRLACALRTSWRAANSCRMIWSWRSCPIDRPAGCAQGLHPGRLPAHGAAGARARPPVAENGLKLDAVIELKVDENILLKRIEKRIAEMSARGETVRADDDPDVLRRRLLAYRDQTAPLVAYYRLQSVLRRGRRHGRRSRRYRAPSTESAGRPGEITEAGLAQGGHVQDRLPAGQQKASGEASKKPAQTAREASRRR